ncbi:hypothetical protein GDO81_016081 [Engystomops pustulosus]|uniref:Uncharacterized protein n=1 Tax=Engystomops pustulosus TaxID=76066 RepID=A0AAV7AZB3_ENGPU|nr:hypothetical protein GDO81_016081 [Engystomops pustulosus]
MRIPDPETEAYKDLYEGYSWLQLPATPQPAVLQGVTHVSAPSTVIVSTGTIAIHGPSLVQRNTPVASPVVSVKGFSRVFHGRRSG